MVDFLWDTHRAVEKASSAPALQDHLQLVWPTPARPGRKLQDRSRADARGDASLGVLQMRYDSAARDLCHYAGAHLVGTISFLNHRNWSEAHFERATDVDDWCFRRPTAACQGTGPGGSNSIRTPVC